MNQAMAIVFGVGIRKDFLLGAEMKVRSAAARQ